MFEVGARKFFVCAFFFSIHFCNVKEEKLFNKNRTANCVLCYQNGDSEHQQTCVGRCDVVKRVSKVGTFAGRVDGTNGCGLIEPSAVP